MKVRMQQEKSTEQGRGWVCGVGSLVGQARRCSQRPGRAVKETIHLRRDTPTSDCPPSSLGAAATSVLFTPHTPTPGMKPSVEQVLTANRWVVTMPLARAHSPSQELCVPVLFQFLKLEGLDAP